MRRCDCARASPAGLPSFAQKNGHSLTRGSRNGSHVRELPRRITRAQAGRVPERANAVAALSERGSPAGLARAVRGNGVASA
jgi:hypothetical protein